MIHKSKKVGISVKILDLIIKKNWGVQTEFKCKCRFMKPSERNSSFLELIAQQ